MILPNTGKTKLTEGEKQGQGNAPRRVVPPIVMNAPRAAAVTRSEPPGAVTIFLGPPQTFRQSSKLPEMALRFQNKSSSPLVDDQLCPARMRSFSRSSLGITIWYFGETVTRR
jgi:hypothetical protein